MREWGQRREVESMSIQEMQVEQRTQAIAELVRATILKRSRESLEKSYLEKNDISSKFTHEEIGLIYNIIESSYLDLDIGSDSYWFSMFTCSKDPIKKLESIITAYSEDPDSFKYKYLSDLLDNLVVSSYLRLAFHLIYENKSITGISKNYSLNKAFSLAFYNLANLFELYPKQLSKSPYLREVYEFSKAILEFKTSKELEHGHHFIEEHDNWFYDFMMGKTSSSFIVWTCENDKDLRIALRKTTWEEELEKCKQWDIDMETAEDLTDEEEEAYERVMQRLGA
jgi:hypothetical protein